MKSIYTKSSYFPQGSIKDPSPRRNIKKAIYPKLFLFIPEFIWISLCTSWAFGDSFTCDDSVVLTARVAIAFSWLIFFLLFIYIVVAFDPIGSSKNRFSVMTRVDGGVETMSVGQASNKKIWLRRFVCSLYL